MSGFFCARRLPLRESEQLTLWGASQRGSTAEHMYVESMPSAHAALFAPALIS